MTHTAKWYTLRPIWRFLPFFSRKFRVAGLPDDVGDIPYVLITVPRDKFIKNDEGGCIYVLPSDTFETDQERGLGSAEWASPEPVVPSEKIDYPSALEAMLENGVQVYFITPEKLNELKSMPDKGRSYLASIKSENQKRGVNVKEFTK